MLVLSRKRDERIFVTTADGSEIIITVVAIQGDRVRLGFECAIDIKIVRSELLDLVKEGTDGND